MTSLLRNTVALVTGGGSGLGAAAVRALLQRGARVVVGDLSEESFQTNVVDPLRSMHHNNHGDNADTAGGGASSLLSNVHFCRVDVTQPETITAGLDAVQDKFGQPLNAVVNSAGIGTAGKTVNKKGEATTKAMDEFSQTLQVNTIGSFHVARLAAERMAATEKTNDKHGGHDDTLRGCIIQTASIAAYEGQAGQVAYAASKAAIVGMTLPMARDLAPWGIRVVTIAPGLFATPLLEGLPPAVIEELGATVPCPNRLGRPSEYGQLVVHIFENPMLNGTTIRLDGALRMPP
ncbi:hypothetical protein ACA910_017691 [Epithemia clementina (nom. ined.)]